ncbi:hypothetical protein Syun_020570 [Stephania yunnanensis]|uniref:BHLH domain-containing protein n=1 Tax=Stephania yunnanensis TaxID=152371 RepID=A0AAP0IE55_9MAGN
MYREEMKRSFGSNVDCEVNNKLDRRTMEKKRRMLMNGLYSTLFSHIPKAENLHGFSSSKGRRTSLLKRLDEATLHIRGLQERVEVLKRKRQHLAMGNGDDSTTNPSMYSPSSNSILKVRELADSTMEVFLICGLNKNFKFYELISVIEEEGAEVVNANFSTQGDKIIHAIHCQAKCPRIGFEISNVRKRLNEFVY